MDLFGHILLGINLSMILAPQTPPFEGFSKMYESAGQMDPIIYRKFSKSTQIPVGKCYDRDNNSFFASMEIKKNNESGDEYEILVKKGADLTEAYRGYMIYGDTHFVSDTDEKTALNLFSKNDKFFFVGQITSGDGVVKNMCFFSVKAKRAK